MNNFGEVFENVDLKEYSSIKIGGISKYVVIPDSEENLSNLIKYLKKENIKYCIFGNMSNVIVDDSFFDGVVIFLKKFNHIQIDGNLITAGSHVMLSNLVNKAFENNLVSLYFLAMIPGVVGGSIVGNAGCYGHEIMEYVKSVKVMDYDGNILLLNKDDIKYSYRDTSLKGKYIVLEVTFESQNGDVNEYKNILKENRMKKISSQPVDKPSVGSIFRNPENDSAGRLIDSLELKGYFIGGAKVSEKHANFIINEKNATFNDIITLIKYIHDKVYEEFKIDLVLEPKIIKWNDL